MDVEVVPVPVPHTPPRPKPPEPAIPKEEPAPKPETAKSPPPLPPPPVPQLQRGIVAEHSHSGGQNQEKGDSGEPKAKPGPLSTFSLQQAPANGTPKAKGGGQFGPPGLAPVTQNEHDFILAQVVDKWRFNYSAPEGHDLTLYAVITVNADGTLASPMNRSDPWNPAGIVPGYEQTSLYVRAAIDSFLLALRLAQSFELPPNGHWPKKMQIEFRFRDLHLQ